MPQLAAPASATSQARFLALLALLLVVPMATVGEGAALWLWPGSVLGITLFWLAKVWLTAVPAVWRRRVERQPLSWSPARAGGFGVAIVLGLLIFGVIWGAYAIARHNHWIDLPAMRQAIAKNHLDIWWVYLSFTLLISTANALMEEYVWRWFVFRQCAALMPTALAVLLAALFFTGHHVSALKLYFDWRVTLLGSSGVFLGGVLWSCLYLRYRSVWPGVVSHILADLALFSVGAHMIFGPR